LILCIFGGGIKMNKFILVKDDDINKNDIKHRKIYESEFYKLRIFNYESGYNSIDIFKNEGEYIPNLYIENDDKFKVIDIKISTTSYGSLSADEIQKVIIGYNIAIQGVAGIKQILKDNNLLDE
jgi:hypothetical protein